jgi:hypothetical protein
MTRRWFWRVRYYALTCSAGGLFLLGGCGLTDQQLAAVWQSVITAGLTSIVSNAITTAFGGAAA